MDKVTVVIDYVLAYIASVPAHSWYVLGSVLGAILTTIGVTAWVKRRHFKKYADKLKSEFIVLNVTFWGFVSTIAAFITTQGTNFAPFLPFLGTHWAQISGGAIAVHAVATGLSKWWKDRKANKPVFAANLPDLKPMVEQINTPVTPSAAPTQPIQPTSNLLQ